MSSSLDVRFTKLSYSCRCIIVNCTLCEAWFIIKDVCSRASCTARSASSVDCQFSVIMWVLVTGSGATVGQSRAVWRKQHPSWARRCAETTIIFLHMSMVWIWRKRLDIGFVTQGTPDRSWPADLESWGWYGINLQRRIEDSLKVVWTTGRRARVDVWHTGRERF